MNLKKGLLTESEKKEKDSQKGNKCFGVGRSTANPNNLRSA